MNMHPHSGCPTAQPARALLVLQAAVLALAFAPLPTHAGLSEPDNVVYGRITLEGQPVTAARTDVVVEARRSPDGPALARYRMGEDRRVGDFYKLRLRLEHAAPLTADEASLTGDRLHIVASTTAGPLAQTTLELGQRGQITRIDLEDSNPDQDQNGLADEWETLHFGSTGVDPSGDPDADGRTNLKEFLDGTDPKVPNLHKLLAVALVGGNRVQLQAVGLPGKTYSIQATDNLGSGNWETIAQQTAPTDGHFMVEHTDSPPRSTRYFRSVEQ